VFELNKFLLLLLRRFALFSSRSVHSLSAHTTLRLSVCAVKWNSWRWRCVLSHQFGKHLSCSCRRPSVSLPVISLMRSALPPAQFPVDARPRCCLSVCPPGSAVSRQNVLVCQTVVMRRRSIRSASADTHQTNHTHTDTRALSHRFRTTFLSCCCCCCGCYAQCIGVSLVLVRHAWITPLPTRPCGVPCQYRQRQNRGGFKAESFLGHITRRPPPLPSHPLPSFLPSVRSRPLKSN